MDEGLRALPAVDRVIAALSPAGPHAIVASAARAAVEAWRERVRAGEDPPSFDQVVVEAQAELDLHARSLLTRLINATGVLIHTNLGRVPLGQDQLDEVRKIAGGYSNLEYDLEKGRRGSRYTHASQLITSLTGAEAGLVVNNNAAAVLLVLAALCEGREVVISRGELIEIGGEFRIPEVMNVSGARLVEVGTTNRTHLVDYERALTPDTAAILKVHPSNYRVVGFTASVAGRDLARLARGRGVIFVHDLGSGLIQSGTDTEWSQSEPPVEASLADGADIITFSGDKLLGGPQAGVIAGRKELVEKIATHPLLRALRVDKMTLAALEATLIAYLNGRHEDLPLWRMALIPLEELEESAVRISDEVAHHAGAKVEAVATAAVTGGGSLPGREMPSWAIAVTHDAMTADEIERVLRLGTPPIIGRIEDDRVLLDLRTVPPDDDDTVLAALQTVLDSRQKNEKKKGSDQAQSLPFLQLPGRPG